MQASPKALGAFAMKKNHNTVEKHRLPKTKLARYVRIDNGVIDARLPANAFQVLCILLRDSDDFQPSKADLLRRVAFGPDALDTAIQQLKDGKYLRIDQDKTNPSVWRWVVSESPTLDGRTPIIDPRQSGDEGSSSGDGRTTTVTPRSPGDDNQSEASVSGGSASRTIEEVYIEVVSSPVSNSVTLTNTSLDTEQSSSLIDTHSHSVTNSDHSSRNRDEQSLVNIGEQAKSKTVPDVAQPVLKIPVPDFNFDNRPFVERMKERVREQNAQRELRARA